jgi:hypothetical protein
MVSGKFQDRRNSRLALSGVDPTLTAHARSGILDAALQIDFDVSDCHVRIHDVDSPRANAAPPVTSRKPSCSTRLRPRRLRRQRLSVPQPLARWKC